MCEFCSKYSVDMHVRGGLGTSAQKDVSGGGTSGVGSTTTGSLGTGAAYYVEALLNSNNGNFLSWDGAWNNKPVAGSAATVTYRMNWENVDRYGSDSLGGAEQNAIKAALSMYSSYANITFQETSGTANIGFSEGNLGGGGKNFVSGITHTARYDNGHIGYSDVYVSNQNNMNFSEGGAGWATTIHEIGHALGLKHPGNYNTGSAPVVGPNMPGAEDNNDLSVMSYKDGIETAGRLESSTAMLYDISAIQFLYGANHNYNAGNNTYTFTGAQKIWTLWDGNGNDTLDASGVRGNHRIDLREGKDFYSKVGSERVWAAFGANIENGIGGTGNDTIHGNDGGNYLSGLDGNDKLLGYQGNDYLFGGKGSDSLEGGAGNDTLEGFSGADVMSGGKGADTFIFSRTSDSTDRGVDTVQFVQADGDKLDFSGLDGTLTFVGNNAFSGAGNEVRFSITNGNTLVFVDTSGDSHADMQIQLIGEIHLNANDFTL